MIRPERTRYRGILFRSKTEAGWAVVFDKYLKEQITWDYEPEYFKTPHGRYAPDFLLKERSSRDRLWFEVKGRPPTEIEIEKIDFVAHEDNSTWVIVWGSIWDWANGEGRCLWGGHWVIEPIWGLVHGIYRPGSDPFIEAKNTLQWEPKIPS